MGSVGPVQKSEKYSIASLSPSIDWHQKALL